MDSLRARLIEEEARLKRGEEERAKLVKDLDDLAYWKVLCMVDDSEDCRWTLRLPVGGVRGRPRTAGDGETSEEGETALRHFLDLHTSRMMVAVADSRPCPAHASLTHVHVLHMLQVKEDNRRLGIALEQLSEKLGRAIDANGTSYYSGWISNPASPHDLLIFRARDTGASVRQAEAGGWSRRLLQLP